jgi:Protein of unknown function (DUF1761)
MTLDLGGINWIAVVIATVAYFALGAVWFAPQTPIGRAWAAASGYTSPTSGAASTSLFYVFPIVSSFIAVVATAMLARATTTDTIGEGIILGLVVGIGYAGAILVSTSAFEFSKPNRWTWGLIDASYHVVALVIAAVILALIR